MKITFVRDAQLHVNQLLPLSEVESNESVLVINYQGLYLHDYVAYTINALMNQPKHSKLLAIQTDEPPDIAAWDAVIRTARAFGYYHIGVVDVGATFTIATESTIDKNHVDITHFFNPSCIGIFDDSWLTPVKPTEREKKLTYLVGVPRPHRVILMSKLLENGVSPTDSVLSCGWHHWDPDSEALVAPEFRHLFPMPFSLDQNELIENCWAVSHEIKSAVINVIGETSYEKYNTFTDHWWDRMCMTEKTGKAYYLRQLPIWSSVKGIVQYQRDLGFDVFDDIINHSYDNERDPTKRLDMVAAEATRLYKKYSLLDLQRILVSNYARFEINQYHLEHLQNTASLNIKENLVSWCLAPTNTNQPGEILQK